MPRLVWSLSRQRGKNDFPLENPGREGTEEQFSSVLDCSKVGHLNQISALNRPASAHKNGFKEAIASNYTVSKLNYIHEWPICYGPDICSTVCLLLNIVLCAKNKITLGFTAALPFPISITAIISWNVTPGILFLFNFLSTKTKRCLLTCQPPLSAQQNVPKISPYQETILGYIQINAPFHFKIEGISFAFSQEYKTNHPGISVCICSSMPFNLFVYSSERVCVRALVLDSQHKLNRLPGSPWQPSHDFLFPEIIYRLK